MSSSPVRHPHRAFFRCARHGHVLTGESPERGRQWQPHSQEQGVRREAQAERSWRQTLELMNKNLIRHMTADKLAEQSEVR